MKFGLWGNRSTASQEESKPGVDFSGKSNDELLDQFRSDNWDNLQTQDRVALIQELENRNAAYQNREAATIVPISGEDYLGARDSRTNTIEIDVEGSPYETLDTYVHESNHAMQEFCVENQTGYDPNTGNLIMVETLRDNEGHLINYENASPRYDMMCNELDSNNKAASVLLAQHERYESDPKYTEYINERLEHYNYVNSQLVEQSEVRFEMQRTDVDKAYQLGTIDDETYSTLNSYIENGQYYDTPAYDSLKVEEELQNEMELLQSKQEELNQDVQPETNDGEETSNSYLGEVPQTEIGTEEVSNTYLGEVEQSETAQSIDEESSESYLGMVDEAQDSSNDASMDSSGQSQGEGGEY